MDMNAQHWQRRFLAVVTGMALGQPAAEVYGRPTVNVVTFTRGASGHVSSSPAQTVEPPGGSFALSYDGCNGQGGSQYANASGDQPSNQMCHFASAGAHADE